MSVAVIKAEDRKLEQEGAEKESINAADFETYVQEMHENGNRGFSSQYSLMERGVPSSVDVAKSKFNKAKNRYKNIVPYDHARVVLKELPGIRGSDYINASYIDAYKRPKGYIACQGPSNNTTEDFWRMVCQENVQTIVMVTNLKEVDGKTKCCCYWPALKKTARYGDIFITCEEELVLSESIIRTFKLIHPEEDPNASRTVTQFHFTGWPDHGVPAYATSSLNFIKRVRFHHNSMSTPGPLVVHCRYFH